MRQRAVSILIAALAIAAVSCGGDGGSAAKTPTTTPGPDISPTAVGLHALGRRFAGALGSFSVNQGDLFAGNPCPGGAGEPPTYTSDYQESELWSKVFSSRARPGYCAADNRLLAIFEYAVESIDYITFKRSYFYALPLVVTFTSMPEPPRLLEVEGHEAIVGEETSGAAWLYVIEREPGLDQQGIFDFVLARDVDAAVELAERLIV